MAWTSISPEQGKPDSPIAPTGHVVLVAYHRPAWKDIVAAVKADGVDCQWLPATARATDVVSKLEGCNAVFLLDLAPDPVRAMLTLATVRREVPLVPVVVVAHDPSIDFARRVRLAGVFYMALDPVGADEMRSVLSSAFACLGRRRAEASVCRATRRVLIVDDDADFVASTTALLEAQGYAISSARTAKEGLDQVLAQSPDLLVLDVMMEHDSAGYQVNQALKVGPGFECHRHIPILMVSSIPVDPATRFRMAGEVDMITPNVYLTKPVDVPRFLAEVRALLGEQPEVVPA